MKTKVRLVTNVRKSQISSDADFFRIKEIPVTVDGAVMNGLLYPADENSKGLPSIVNKVMTLGHPKNDAGQLVSANEGQALVNQFSGGSVEKTYLRNGVHYVDAKIRKATLAAQPDGEWFYNQLEQRKPIGVSTGLFSNRKIEEGIAANGDKYFAVAAEQRYDHLALLHESEPPAGGKDTVMQFNAEQDEFIINIDEFAAEDDGIINRVVGKITAMFGDKGELRYNQDDSNSATDLNTNEDNAAMRQFLIEQLTAKGLSVNAEMTDEQLQAELTKALAANEQATDKDSAVLDAVNSLKTELTEVKTQLQNMKDEKLSDEEAEKEKKAKAIAANSKLDFTQDEAMTLPGPVLNKLFAKCGTIAGNASAGFETNTEQSELADYKFPE